jgi:hypothetical protein
MEREALKLALEALSDLLDQTETPPDTNCSCHIAPPCHDCVEYSGIRYAMKQARTTIALMNEALAQPAHSEWNAALDEAAARIGEMKGFGQATQDSFAVYINGLKR